VEELTQAAGTWSGGARSSVASSSSVKSEFKRVTNRSRFWILIEDDDSELELDDGNHAAVSSVEAGREDSHEERAPLRPTPTVVSMSGARTRRPVHPKLMRCGASSSRPWCGPLPPARISPARSLGDLWVTDLRSGVRGACSRLADVLESAAGRRSPATWPEAAEKMKGSRDPNSNSERPVMVPVGLCGPALWAVSGRGYPGLKFHGS
jgi:hypothetical protein